MHMDIEHTCTCMNTFNFRDTFTLRFSGFVVPSLTEKECNFPKKKGFRLNRQKKGTANPLVPAGIGYQWQ